MAAESICDGCGKRAPMRAGEDHHWHKPYTWYERGDKDGIQTACCRKCVDAIALGTGKTGVMLPV